jgi:hypothetical protein
MRTQAAHSLCQRASFGGPGMAEAARALHARAKADRTCIRGDLRKAAYMSVTPRGAHQGSPYEYVIRSTQETVGSFLIDQPKYDSPLFAGGKLGDVLAKASQCPGLRTPILVDWPGLGETGVGRQSKVTVDWKKLMKEAQDTPPGVVRAPHRMNVSIIDVLWETLASVSEDDRPVGVALLGSMLVVSTVDKLAQHGPQIAKAGADRKASRSIPMRDMQASVGDIFQFVSEVSGIRVAADWPALAKAGIGKNEEVSLAFKADLRTSDAVWAVLIQAGGFGKVGCEARDGKLIVGAAKAPPKPPAPRPAPVVTAPPITTPPPDPAPPTTPKPDAAARPHEAPQDGSAAEEHARRRLQLARTYAANKLTDKARAILKSIIKHYPDTDAAKQARKELAALQ